MIPYTEGVQSISTATVVSPPLDVSTVKDSDSDGTAVVHPSSLLCRALRALGAVKFGAGKGPSLSPLQKQYSQEEEKDKTDRDHDAVNGKQDERLDGRLDKALIIDVSHR